MSNLTESKVINECQQDADFYTAILEAKNAELAKQVASLGVFLTDIKRIIETSSAVTDTVWFNDHTTLCDKIELTLKDSES